MVAKQSTFVDANMREPNATGFAITVDKTQRYLVHDLGQDYGRRSLLEHQLLDHDPVVITVTGITLQEWATIHAGDGLTQSVKQSATDAQGSIHLRKQNNSLLRFPYTESMSVTILVCFDVGKST